MSPKRKTDSAGLSIRGPGSSLFSLWNATRILSREARNMPGKTTSNFIHGPNSARNWQTAKRAAASLSAAARIPKQAVLFPAAAQQRHAGNDAEERDKKRGRGGRCGKLLYLRGAQCPGIDLRIIEAYLEILVKVIILFSEPGACPTGRRRNRGVECSRQRAVNIKLTPRNACVHRQGILMPAPILRKRDAGRNPVVAGANNARGILAQVKSRPPEYPCEMNST